MKKLIICIFMVFSFNIFARNVYSFEDIVKKTFSHNYKLKEMQENIDQADIMLSKAYTFLQPIWNFGARFTINNKETSIVVPKMIPGQTMPSLEKAVINEKYAYNFNSTLNYTLLNLRAWPLVKAAKKMKKLRILSKNIAKKEIKYAVARLYINILILVKSNKINELTKINLSKHLNNVKEKIKLKEAIEIEKLKVELEISKLDTVISQTNGLIEQLKSKLASFMGIEDYSFDIKDISFEFFIEDLNKMFRIAKINRTENKLYKKEIEIEKHILDNIYMKFTPTLLLQGKWNWNSSTGFAGDHSSWNIHFILNFPIYSGGMRFKEIKEEKSKIRIAKLKIKNFNEELKQAIKSILIEINNKDLSLTQIDKELEISKKALQLSKDSYKLGVGKNIDVLDSSLKVNLVLQKKNIESLNKNLLYLKLKKELGSL